MSRRHTKKTDKERNTYKFLDHASMYSKKMNSDDIHAINHTETAKIAENAIKTYKSRYNTAYLDINGHPIPKNTPESHTDPNTAFRELKARDHFFGMDMKELVANMVEEITPTEEDDDYGIFDGDEDEIDDYWHD
jgi:hypothetical protein